MSIYKMNNNYSFENFKELKYLIKQPLFNLIFVVYIYTDESHSQKRVTFV